MSGTWDFFARCVETGPNKYLAALVDGTFGKFVVNPPNTRYPTGNGLQVNFVRTPQHHLRSVAQFSIEQVTTTT
jgi:hypothetical protein